MGGAEVYLLSLPCHLWYPGPAWASNRTSAQLLLGFPVKWVFFFNMALSTAQNGCEARLGTVLWGSGKENGVLKLKKKVAFMG